MNKQTLQIFRQHCLEIYNFYTWYYICESRKRTQLQGVYVIDIDIKFNVNQCTRQMIISARQLCRSAAVEDKARDKSRELIHALQEDYGFWGK